ncbi:LOW QUALITY PROTEIN: hypothetical protein PHMEG_00020015 [Phytophthora megakarya]|uniref:Uncharacterized protein n=1 Tax=Phytophthora megakarya TaxID=4795 RepID=A0A225VS12_9STRA|nr:LOW QUALITY PROTEIN: hypothetical protein PHMEG_00020015 [Phytophthora megakarya]
MLSFKPGLGSEVRSAPPLRGEPPVATSSASAQDELHLLRQEFEALRGQVAGVRQSLVVSTERNDQGELPAGCIVELFPEQAKKAKGEYHPPQAHVLAATRMFKGSHHLKVVSPISFVLGLHEAEYVGLKTTPVVLMGLFSGRLGYRKLTILHFREKDEQAALEAGLSNGNFSSDFSPSAALPPASPSCRSYEDICDGIHDLTRMGEAMWHVHMLLLTERLRSFVSKNNC